MTLTDVIHVEGDDIGLPGEDVVGVGVHLFRHDAHPVRPAVETNDTAVTDGCMYEVSLEEHVCALALQCVPVCGYCDLNGVVRKECAEKLKIM